MKSSFSLNEDFVKTSFENVNCVLGKYDCGQELSYIHSSSLVPSGAGVHRREEGSQVPKETLLGYQRNDGVRMLCQDGGYGFGC